jgi:hypothetical protein
LLAVRLAASFFRTFSSYIITGMNCVIHRHFELR